MKKERIIFLLIINIFIFSSLINANINSPITGDTITGEITNANVAVSINVIIEEPSLKIISPKNHTYITTQDLQLNFTSSNTQTIWYNIDQLGGNTTITGNTIFNTTQGTHTLYLYANNSNGNKTSANVSFTVNSSKFRVIYNEYVGSTKGSSTDFNKSTYEDLQNMQGIILENTNYGKIQFNQAINVTNDANISDNKVDLDTNTNISLNRTELNSTALPNFNVSATLYLYNLTFSNPRILKDGVVCPDTICTEIDYSTETGTLIFNVIEFTVYSAEETPAGETPSTGRGSRTITNFSISPEELKIKLKQGETKEVIFILKNTGTKPITINIEKSNLLKDFIRWEETSFTLGAKESKTIILDVIAKENAIPDLYIGKLIIKGDRIEKEILVAIEIESKGALLDLKAEIPQAYKKILPGSEITAKITIFNLGASGKADIEVEYQIRDANGNKISDIEYESMAIETQSSLIKTIYIPENTDHGKYFLYVKATYNGKTASASDNFEVIKEVTSQKEKIYIGIILILIIAISTGIYLYLREKKLKKAVAKKAGARDIIKKK